MFIVEEIKPITGVKTLNLGESVTIIELHNTIPFYIEGYLDLSQMQEAHELQYIEEVNVATQMRTLNRQTVVKADLAEGEALRYPSKLTSDYKLTLQLTKGNSNLTVAHEFYQIILKVM